MRTTTADIAGLIDRINKGEIRLPEIQRGYEWKPIAVAGLIDSLYKQYPSGSLLLWEADEPIYERDLSISGPLEKPLVRPLYLLDGQQRLTSLHRVWTGHERARVVFNVEDQRFQIESAGTRRDSRWVPVQQLLNGEADTFELVEMLRDKLPGLSAKVINERLGRLRKVADYVYYVEVLDGLAYEEVTEIFVRVNSRGRRLRTTDLALATLSARWPGSVRRFEEQIQWCTEQGFPDLGFAFLTRCLAALVSESATPKDFGTAPLKRLENGWENVCRGIEHLLKLLRGHAYVDASILIPSVNALVPVVAFLGLREDAPLEEETRDALLYWLFAAWVQGRFSGSAETSIAQDVAAVRSDDPIGKLYANLSLLGHRLVVTEAMLAGRGASSAYFFLSYLAARRAGANDWWHGVPVSATSDGKYKVEYHHIHPRATLKTRYSKAEINDLANLAFVSAKANRKISSRSPAKYFTEVGEDELGRHFIPLDPELRTPDRYRDFIRERRRLLAETMTDLLDRYRPPFLDAQAAPLIDLEVGEALVIEAYGSSPSDDIVCVLRASAGGMTWELAMPFSNLEQMVAEVADGLGSEIEIGSETFAVEADAEVITVPIGPLRVYGSLEEWQKVLDRELGDLRPLDELPEIDKPAPWEGERFDFRILDSD